MKRTKSERRHFSKAKHASRLKKIKNVRSDELSPSICGKLKDNHWGCGCAMCKPWKHGLEDELKPSERKRLISDE